MMVFDESTWESERLRHPFFGENIGPGRYAKVWDDAAEGYSDAGVSALKEQILERLSEIIGPDTDVLDIGCGPGTYSIPFSKMCRSVVCLDGSGKMLDRIIQAKVPNITCIEADWNTYRTDSRFDLVFSSLCPALNNPANLIKMESVSRGYCAYVSSMNDDSGSLHMNIWHSLGRDYTYNGYNTNYPFHYLKGLGRGPKMEAFVAEEPYDLPSDEVEEKEIKSFSFFMNVDDRIRSVIHDTVRKYSDAGIVHYDGIKRLGLLIWKPVTS